MKKTVLSLAFVLSISISASFAAESKPVVGETKTIVYSLQPKSLDDLKDDITIVYNYSSCGTLNIMVYEGPVSDEEILTDAESFDEEDCG
jgi:hypothetical protein